MEDFKNLNRWFLGRIWIVLNGLPKFSRGAWCPKADCSTMLFGLYGWIKIETFMSGRSDLG